MTTPHDVPMPEPSCYYEGIPTAPLYEHKKLIAYADARCAALRAERNALAEKVKAMEDNDRRYRELRTMVWDRSPLAVVVNPRASVNLGHDCPSHERLDAAIDAATEET